MQEPDNDFESLFKNLKDYKEDPDDTAWDAISGNLNSSSHNNLWKWAAAVLFLVSGVGGLFFWNSNTGSKETSFNSFSLAGVEPLNEIALEKSDKSQKEANHKAVKISNIKNEEHIDTNIYLNSRENLESPFDLTFEEEVKSEYIVTSLYEPGNLERKKANVLLGSYQELEVQVERVELKEIVEEPVIKEKKKEIGKGLKFYGLFMPTMGYHQVKSNKNDDILVTGIEKLATFSTERLGIRAEAGFEYPLSRRLSIYSGLLYFQRKQTLNYTVQIQEGQQVVFSDVEKMFIISPIFNEEVREFDYEVQNLGVSTGLLLRMKNWNKWSRFISTGIEFHKGLGNDNDKVEGGVGNAPALYAFYQVYYRMERPLNKNLNVVVQPTLNSSFYLNSQIHTPIYIKPYGFGLNLGLTYKTGK
jgi:hypothetical protein